MICNKKDCTGCFSCFNICPRHCITMEEDKLGYIYPKINKDKCINCGLCKKVCPQLSKINKKRPINAYAAYSKDEIIRKESTSGGAATIFYSYILNNNGVVYGCTNFEDNSIKFLRVTNEKDINKLKKSKYVHAYIGDAYSKVKEDLKANKQVLFIGTPCQVSGLKSFLNKEYDNLILIDIVCHGVSSQKLLFEDIRRMTIEPINKITFREKDKYKICIYTCSNQKIDEEIYENPYLYGFMHGVNLRPNCYTCKYATPDRISDITIGDFWGLGEDSKMYQDKDKGVSLIMPITLKGEKLLENVKDKLIIEKRSIDEAVKGNSQLQKPSIENKKSQKFREEYLKSNYSNAIKKYMFGVKLHGIVKGKLKNNVIIYKIYKMLKR